MSERTSAVVASVATLGAALLAALWMTRIGAWGPAVYTLVLATAIVWLLIAAERRRSSEPVDDERRHHGYEWTSS